MLQNAMATDRPIDAQIAGALIADAKKNGADVRTIRLACRPLTDEDKRFPTKMDLSKAKYICSWSCPQ